ncbi:MAG: AbrB/MazE/SpoVT family DNA-binding domain-containing protein [Bacillaceae bacterium]|nr:AbrB/MazE/SpoVT family DNA-binding domain-containing protein [Bacillaceae bacterium]
MKATGMVRKVDELGRVVLPIELRRTMGIEIKDAMEIYVDNNKIILQKYQPACLFCDNADNIKYYKDKMICSECIDKIKDL